MLPMSRGFTAALLFVTLAVAADPVRLPVPSSKDVQKSEQLIKDLFKADYLKLKPADKVTLAEKLLKNATDTKDDPVSAYVLLTESRRMALLGGNVDLARQATETMSSLYAVDATALMKEIHEEVAKRATTRDTQIAAVRSMMEAIRQHFAANDFDAAADILKLVEPIAGRTQHAPTIAIVTECGKDIALMRLEHEKYRSAKATLTTRPMDPDANRVVGCYLGLFQENWGEGLLHLQASNDDAMKQLAEAEKANLTDAAKQLTLADGWYDAAAKHEGALKKGMQRRAFYWYSKLVEDLTGLTKARVANRLTELAPLVREVDLASIGGTANVFSMVRQAHKEKNYTTVEAQGGTFTNNDFRELGPETGLLIGFNLAISRFAGRTEYVSSMQPIYRLSTGVERTGRVLGKPLPFRYLTLKAKADYAVGAFHVMGGGNLDHFSMTFMKITPTGLDPKTSYTSPVVGSETKKTIVDIDGKGAPIVGLHGREGSSLSIGILTPVMGSASPAAKKTLPR